MKMVPFFLYNCHLYIVIQEKLYEITMEMRNYAQFRKGDVINFSFRDSYDESEFEVSEIVWYSDIPGEAFVEFTPVYFPLYEEIDEVLAELSSYQEFHDLNCSKGSTLEEAVKVFPDIDLAEMREKQAQKDARNEEIRRNLGLDTLIS